MRFNVSEVIDYDNCPELHRKRWVEKAGGHEGSFALDLGTAAHKSLRQIIIGEQRDKIVDLVGKTLSTKDENQAKAMDLVLDHWATIPRTWKVLDSEKLLELDQTDREGRTYTLYGTPDLVVEWNGLIWHVQHKTLALQRPLWTYVKEIKVSLHEGLYGAMIEKHYGGYSGCMLNVIKKISLKNALIAPASGMHLEFMKIGPELRTAVLADLLDRKYELEKAYGNTGPAYRKRKHCMGLYGNKACWNYEACHGTGTGTVGSTSAPISWPDAKVAAPVGNQPDMARVFIEGQDFSGGPVDW